MRSDPRSGSSSPAAYSTAVAEPANRQGALLRWRSDFLLFLITLAAIAGAAVVAVVAFEHAYIGIDDANISMVYAQHLADGHGFVYNIGDERVEGFTSFFHVLIEAAVFGLLPVPELFLIGFSVLCVTFAVFLLIKSLDALWSVDTDSKARFSPLQLVVIAWVVCAPFFVFWSTVSLMETALWCLLLSSGVALVLFEVMGGGRARARLAGITALAVLIPLTRPEGFVLAPVIIVAFAAARRFCSSSWSAALRAAILPVGLWAATVAGITVFRLAYFGFPLPNTYYAKVSPNTLRNVSEGVDYLARFLVEQPLAIIVALATVAGLVGNGRLVIEIVRSRPRARGVTPESRRDDFSWFLVSLIALVGLSVPVYSGGDHLEGFRFYQPFWPILVLPVVFLGGRVARALGDRNGHRRPLHRWAAAVAMVPVFFVAAGAPWPRQPQAGLLDQLIIAEDGRRLGAALNRLFGSAPPAVGVTAAGGVKYTYRGPIFDLLGLNHVAMGHSPGERLGFKNHAAFNKDVFWSDAPAIVLPILCPGPIEERLAGPEFETLSDGILKELFWDERFRSRYVLVTVGGRDDQQLLDRDPFFFVPSRLPAPRADGTGFRNATLIAFVNGSTLARLRAQGWNVSILPRSRDEASTRRRPSPELGACAPRRSS